jgi:hypothetical protein
MVQPYGVGRESDGTYVWGCGWLSERGGGPLAPRLLAGLDACGPDIGIGNVFLK